MKKSISVLLTIFISVSFIYVSVYATEGSRTKDPDNVSTEESTENDNSEKKDESPQKAESPVPSGPDIKAEAAFLINPGTGVVIYEKNADQRMYPASTTKIMTAYLALTQLDLNKEYEASATAVDIDRDGSNMGLSKGEILTARQLIDSLIIHSANDAANVLAEAVSGSISEFVNLMNQTAKDLGMTGTHFANPHGYHADDHYTTARDMAILAGKAMENETFAEMVGMKRLTIPPTNKYDEERVFSTRNALINPYSDIRLRYTAATGIKTGHTSNAGYCFVGSSTLKNNGNMELVSVVFKSTSYDQAFYDTINLFEHARKNFYVETVVDADELASTCNVKWAWGKEHLVLKTNADVKTVLPRYTSLDEHLERKIEINDNIVAPVEEGAELGKVKVYYDGELVAESKLYASRSVSRNYFKQLLSYLLNPWTLSALGIIVVSLVLLKIRETGRKKRKAN